MFISWHYEFVFLEVPRTGSRAVTNALTELDQAAPTAVARRKFGSSFEYHDFRVPAELAEAFFVFAAHRNPYSRLWSFWNHRHRSGNPAIFKRVSWERYVDWVCEPSSVPEIQGANRDRPISEMFDCEAVDFWLCFETLDRSWTELGERLNLELPPLQRRNASRQSGSFRSAFDAALADRVADRFSADFDRFHYERDSWKPR